METPSPHPSLLVRKIIHLDMDAFFASIEIRDNQYKHVPEPQLFRRAGMGYRRQ